ncbi:MAG: ATP-binding protein, partial [Methanobacteriota archaeon]
LITKRNRIDIVGEVKWKKANQKDIERFNRKAEGLPGRKVIIFREGELGGSINADNLLADL